MSTCGLVYLTEVGARLKAYVDFHTTQNCRTRLGNMVGKSYTLMKRLKPRWAIPPCGPRKSPHDQLRRTTACRSFHKYDDKVQPHLFPEGGNHALDLGRQGGRLRGSYHNK
ncbi:hypothetical protein PIB30_068396 [Stylosanthes scabra]|uniref:Uncharacterized protein n=1 Tax=Stylosanthes scabra TaxID=79078 RepID=A0ABU6WNI5_9FABA|nr:hypothetical protein [Stylosanthes scabra]